MKFLADLHIHSKYSMATAKNSDVENLYISAAKKGISVVGTGDFTHPEWIKELEEKLVEDNGSGLFKLKKEIEKELIPFIPQDSGINIRFMLQSEISSIYKKNGKVRKNHNLVFFPSFESAKKFNAKLDLIGNIKSDGRPILGLDARNLLEIALETDENSFLVPAHIWTPWFSLFGSKSGFDSIEECFEDLTSEIFALETGLSSDPLMNWTISGLDRFTLISNSDAHSPAKLGREVNIFDCEMSYNEIKDSLKKRDINRFKGTFEFFPEEGKYHFDGHRKCNVCLSPDESLKMNGICPVCGKNMTLGVMYRVSQLADRKDIEEIKKVSPPFYSIVPLTDILSEILNVGPNTKKVKTAFEKVIDVTGSEFNALWWAEDDLIESCNIPLLKEAVIRMRNSDIDIHPGYDGEFGRVKIFNEKEKSELILDKQKSLFNLGDTKRVKTKKKSGVEKINKTNALFKEDIKKDEKKVIKKELNPEQKQAVLSDINHNIIIAGPGTGKTSTLTSKIIELIKNRNYNPKNILALTFTVKAADEMKDRIKKSIDSDLPFTGTFHNFCLKFLKDSEFIFEIIDDETKKIFIKRVLNKTGYKTTPLKALKKISSLKQTIDILKPDLEDEFINLVFIEYEKLKKNHKLIDFDDILLMFVDKCDNDPKLVEKLLSEYLYILIDEYQDLNEIQYEIIKKISNVKTPVFAIGDPDQSIYGFRGADFNFLNNFKKDFKDVEILNLKQNYRSTQTIIDASFQVIKGFKNNDLRQKVYSGSDDNNKIIVRVCEDEYLQASWISNEIQNLIGGTGHHITYRKNYKEGLNYSFSDIAVLCRTKKETDIISSVFEKNSIPHNKINEEKLIHDKALKKFLSYLKMLIKDPDITDYILSPFNIKSDLKNIEDLDYKNLKIIENLKKIRQTLKNKKIYDIINYLLDNTDLNQLKEDYAFLNKIDYLKEYSNNFDSLEDYLSYLKLIKLSDIKIPGEKINLMTIHASKGLEFPVVFVPGCVNGNIPLIKDGEKPDMEEERRIFYVALTRAGKRLYLTRPLKKNIYGKKTKVFASPFLTDFEKKMVNEKILKNRVIEAKKEVQLKLF